MVILLTISHIGSSSFSHHDHKFHLHNILHVPSIQANLSIFQFFEDNNCHYDFLVKDNKSGKILFRGHYHDDLYPLQLRAHHTNKSVSSPPAFSSAHISSDIWYHRLGHPSHHTKQILSTTLSLSRSSKPLTICPSCQMGKISRLPFPLSNFVSSFPLDLIHIDVWEPTPNLSISGE